MWLTGSCHMVIILVFHQAIQTDNNNIYKNTYLWLLTLSIVKNATGKRNGI